MKRINIILSFAIICAFCCSTIAKADSKNLYLSVGEEEKISLPSDFSSSGYWSNKDPTVIDIVSESSYSITIKVLKWVYHTCLLEYKESYGGLKTYSVFISINKPIVELSASPSGGKVEKGTTVYLSCTKYDADIYYTLDGYTPTKNSSKYYSGITINETCTLKAFATWGGVDSDVLTEKYTVNSLSLTASPSGGVVEKGTTVYLESEYGADIYYTLDGYTPSRYSTLYTSSGITINESCTLKAIAYKGDMKSEVLSESYTLPVDPTRISVSLSSSSIKVGETATAKYTLSPWNARSSVSWTSDDPKIAAVNKSTGKVTGASAGTTFIRATTANGLSDYCSITVTGEGNVFVNPTNFPDDEFRRCLLSKGIISEEDVKKQRILDVPNENVGSLKGIEYFKALEYLTCSGNHIVSLDVSKNTYLKELICSYNQLTSINVSNNLTYLYCSGNQLTSLDLSGNSYLKTIYAEHNQIKGKPMNALIASLPIRPDKDGKFYARDPMSSDRDWNWITGSQVAAAEAKGWTVYLSSYPYGTISVNQKKGDVDDDGVIDEDDIKIVVQCIMGKQEDGVDLKKADVNGDKKVNAADVVEVVNIIKVNK